MAGRQGRVGDRVAVGLRARAALDADGVEPAVRDGGDHGRPRARVDGLIKRSQVAFEARQFERSQDHATRALEIDPSNSLAYEMLNAATKAGRDSANDGYWRARAAEIRKMLEAHEELKTPQTEILILDPEVWARAQGRSARRDGPPRRAGT